MKLFTCLALCFAVAFTSCAKETNIQNLPKPTEKTDKFSYVYGYDIGSTYAKDSLDINPKYLINGVLDAWYGKEAKFSEEEFKELSKELDELFRKRKAEKMADFKNAFLARGEKYKVEGPKFLEANKQKTGVSVTTSGLQYKVITPGSGVTPKDNDEVSVHIIGTFIDGKEFENTYKMNSVTLEVSRLFTGMQEAIKLMHKGEKTQFVIPSELAFGEQGAGRTFPPHSILIYEIELLDIISK